MPATVDTAPVLETLVDHGCTFVVVGSAARRLCGDAVEPADLDIVVDPAPAHREPLVAALSSLDATIERRHGTRRIQDAVALPWQWGWRAETRFGPIDVIVRFVDGSGFAEHHDAGSDVTLSTGQTIRCRPTRHPC